MVDSLGFNRLDCNHNFGEDVRIEPLKEAATCIWSLLSGLFITGKNFLKPQITTIYPYKGISNVNTFHGHIELTPSDDDSSIPRCIACQACARACPSDCIEVIAQENPSYIDETSVDKVESKTSDAPVELVGDRLVPKVKHRMPTRKVKRVPSVFTLDFTKCSLCGQCIDVCPADAIVFSNNVYLATTNREELIMDLIARLKKEYS